MENPVCKPDLLFPTAKHCMFLRLPCAILMRPQDLSHNPGQHRGKEFLNSSKMATHFLLKIMGSPREALLSLQVKQCRWAVGQSHQNLGYGQLVLQTRSVFTNMHVQLLLEAATNLIVNCQLLIIGTSRMHESSRNTELLP